MRAENKRQHRLILDLEVSQKKSNEHEKDGRHAQLELMVENVTGQFYKALSRTNQAEQRITELEELVAKSK